MHTISLPNRQFSPQLRQRLTTAAIGLGLARLQMVIGRASEAKETLESLQLDVQSLRHAQQPKTSRKSRRRLEALPC